MPLEEGDDDESGSNAAERDSSALNQLRLMGSAS